MQGFWISDMRNPNFCRMHVNVRCSLNYVTMLGPRFDTNSRSALGEDLIEVSLPKLLELGGA